MGINIKKIEEFQSLEEFLSTYNLAKQSFSHNDFLVIEMLTLQNVENKYLSDINIIS